MSSILLSSCKMVMSSIMYACIFIQDISQIVNICHAGLYMPVFSACISKSHGSFDDSKPSNDHQCLRDFLRHLVALAPSVHTNNISDSLKMLTIVSTRVWRVFMHCSVRSGNGACHSGSHCLNCYFHYNDVIMSAMASRINGVSIACSTVGSGADQRKLQSSASLAFVRGTHRWPVNSPHRWLVTRKMFPSGDVIMFLGPYF